MFFQGNDAPVLHEVSPMADPSVTELLNERGYKPIELTSVLYRSLDAGFESPSNSDARLTTRIIGPGEVDLWAATSAAGWATEGESLGDFMFGFVRISAQGAGSFPFFAEFDGEPIATGMLFVHKDVAIMAGASTIPKGRRKGAQNALLDARLLFAADKGCTLATMGARPGSQSQRNAEKNNFRIAYTRTKWRLAPSSDSV
jgi:hypothetical protein